MNQYNKAIAGLLTPILTAAIVAIAQRYGYEVDIIAAGFAAGIITGFFVWLVKNAPPELVQAMEDATGMELDGNE